MTIRAVVVDDDEETLDLFCDLLTSHKIKIVGKGYNGQEAVFLYQKLKPDVIFLDDSMPVYSGIEALQKIKELNPNAIVFMIIGEMKLNTELTLNKLHPSAVFHEPVDINRIIQKTHQLCLPSKDELETMQKTMITLSLKNALLELGNDELEKVIMMLHKDYNISLDDCYDNPDSLKQVLQDLFGESYSDISNSIKENLKEISTKSHTKIFINDTVESLENSYQKPTHSTFHENDPLQILQRRLALGEVSKEEFEDLSSILENKDSDVEEKVNKERKSQKFGRLIYFKDD